MLSLLSVLISTFNDYTTQDPILLLKDVYIYMYVYVGTTIYTHILLYSAIVKGNAESNFSCSLDFPAVIM